MLTKADEGGWGGDIKQMPTIGGVGKPLKLAEIIFGQPLVWQF